MSNDEQHEPDLDAIVREVGWIDHKAKRSAELAYEQARAHYEPQLAAAKAENERLAKRANKNRWIRIAEAEGRRASGLRSGLDKALNKIRMLERRLERETRRRVAAEQAWQRWIDGHQIEGDYFVNGPEGEVSDVER